MKTKRMFLNSLVMLVSVVIVIYILHPHLFPRRHERKFRGIETKIDKWEWAIPLAFMVDIQEFFGKENRFPEQSELEKVIKERISNEPYLIYKDTWGNQVFYYNGREEGKCVWYGSMGPDGLWFTGSRDPETIIDRINSLSVGSEFEFYSGRISARGISDKNFDKYLYLIIGDDHVVLVDINACIYYIPGGPARMFSDDILSEARTKLHDIGSYEKYKELYGDKCIVHAFLESEVEGFGIPGAGY